MDDVRLELQGHTATIVIDRPNKLNAMTPEMSAEMVAITERVNADDAIRVAVLTGAGERAFCAGSDIAELDAYDTPWEFRNRPDYCDAVRHIRKPVIAAVNGFALGGGLELALSCDIRIAAENARLGAPEIKLGWIGGGGMSTFLAHSIGPSNAAMMLMTGDPIPAAQALGWGLLSEVLPSDELGPRAAAIAALIGERAPIAAQTAKLNLRAAFSMPLESAIHYERDLQTIAMATEDAGEGRRAFKEKRPPQFRGR